MGIYLLNSFLKSLTNNGSRKLDLSELSGKKIVIDTSIYLYRFKAMNALLENMYLLCTILRYYNISALFIFDGKASDVKNTTLKKRKEVTLFSLSLSVFLACLFGLACTCSGFLTMALQNKPCVEFSLNS